MKKYDIAVFDVDGTLLDTTEGVLSSVRFVIDAYKLQPLKEDEMRTFIGPPIQNSFAKYYGIQGDKLQEMADCFRNHYKEKDLLKAKPYDGIFDVLQALRDNKVKIAIATYKRQDYALDLLCHFKFDKYAQAMYGADNLNRLKKKDIIIKCMNKLNMYNYDRAVMIGDSDNDAIGARDIGMNFLGVCYGFDFKDKNDVEKYPSIGCASSAIEICSYLI